MSRLVFANQLRGLAALSVACSHLLGVFWAMRPFVSLATASPPQPGALPPVFALVSHTWFNLGPFGVGLFFLISGLVVPFSLAAHTRSSFLLARLLRIYPTYVAAVLLEMAVLHAAAAFWGRPFPYGGLSILSNLLLVYNAVGLPSIDLVNWTLCIELKFYLVLALIAPSIRAGRASVLFTLAGIILALNLLLASPLVGAGLRSLAWIDMFRTESLFVIFMLIGVLFHFRLLGGLRRAVFPAAICAMVALFVACWQASAIAGQYPVVSVNYGYALLLFTLLFGLRRWVRPLPLLDRMAALSYPFYLIHSLIGFSLLKVLMLAAGMGYLPALVLTIACLLCLAALLHWSVERPTIALGRRLGRAQRVRSSAAVVPAGSFS